MTRSRLWLAAFLIVQVAAIGGAVWCIGHEWQSRPMHMRYGNVRWQAHWCSTDHYRGYPFPWDGMREVVHFDDDNDGNETESSRDITPESGNAAFPALLMLLALTTPWVIVNSFRRSKKSRFSRLVTVVLVTTFATGIFTVGDTLTGHYFLYRGYLESRPGHCCWQYEVVRNTVNWHRQRRTTHLGEPSDEVKQKYSLIGRTLHTHTATRTTLAFVASLFACSLLYRPWRRFDSPPAPAPADNSAAVTTGPPADSDSAASQTEPLTHTPCVQ